MAAPVNAFPNDISFRKEWREYQARVLDHLDSYLGDNKLHVVAAPGSGKTVLGLEIVRRFNHPALVVAPTITIREQWADRFVEHFMPDGCRRPEWISTDIHSPGFLTIVTYQALHAGCVGEVEGGEAHVEDAGPLGEEAESACRRHFSEPLANAGIKTLVLDEAHHLRAEWWKSLTFVAENLEQPTVVALTATPPYDVTLFEWQRYEQLCGPVDAEVSVPELVSHGDLCPHQDYVYLTAPDAKEQATLTEFRAAVDAFVQRLKVNEKFADVVAGHAWVVAPGWQTEEILENPEVLSSLLIFLNAVNRPLPSEAIQVLGIARKALPLLDLEWLEILLTHLLFDMTAARKASISMLSDLRKELTEMGAVERRKVKLRNPSDHLKLLTSSSTKLAAIAEIVKLEGGSLGQGLRCVVLTDYIRKSELGHSEEMPACEEIGVAPIFDSLRQAALPNVNLGVLSGSLVVLPTSAKQAAEDCALSIGIGRTQLVIKPLAYAPEYSEVELRGESNRSMVRLITAVFEAGAVNVLVGTKSLLGEGWDAPCINALILASFVGSYVLSNQMRGRSIRTDRARLNKTANIWHLVCVEPGVFGPGEDYELLVRRCGAFVGVHASKPRIEDGVERLGLGHPPFAREQIESINASTRQRALDRDGLRTAWETALELGDIKQMTNGLWATAESSPRGFLLTGTIAALLTQSLLAFSETFVQIMRRAGNWRGNQDFASFAATAIAVSMVICSPWAMLAVWRFARHGTPERSIRQIGRAIHESLEYEGSIDTKLGDFQVHADRNDDGTVFCWLSGGGGKEQSVFLHALREVLRPVDNPRYLLSRRKLARFFREDYFAVPEIFGRKKEFAEYFSRRWSRAVSPMELVFTRNLEGRKMLLRARAHSLAAAFQERAERRSCWK